MTGVADFATEFATCEDVLCNLTGIEAYIVYEF